MPDRRAAVSGSRTASRQAAALFGLSGVLAVLEVPAQSDHQSALVGIAAADFATAVLALLLPWARWRREAVAWLGVPAFGILGLSTWAFNGVAAGTGPFFVLVFAWLGLNFSERIVVRYMPLAAVSYAGPLLVAGASADDVGSTLVLVPIATAVGVIIAERVRRLHEARDETARAERWRAALMASLAHDVRIPLTTIQGALEIVTDEEGLPESHRRLLDAAAAQAARIARMSTTLLDVERVESGRLHLSRQRVRLVETLRPLLDLLGATDVRIEVEPGLEVDADPDRLDQIIANLVSNAMRYGAPPVVVTARRDDGFVRIEVRDHGAGLDAAHVAHLFERFPDDAGKEGSIGLGLWSTRLLVDAHGGSLHYRPGDPGAVFSARLPTAVEAEGPGVAAS